MSEARLSHAAVPASSVLPAGAMPQPLAPAPAPVAPRPLRPVVVPDGALIPAPGPYLGGATGESTHRVSFSVLGDRVRNLRIDGRDMGPNAKISNGRIETHHLGFELVAEWIDDRHVEGKVRMRGRWGRGVSFGFTARHRVRDVLSG